MKNPLIRLLNLLGGPSDNAAPAPEIAQTFALGTVSSNASDSPRGPRKLLFLGDCYLDGAEWGPFQKGLLAYLSTAFDEILAVKANAFFREWVGNPRSERHLQHVRETVRPFDPDLILSINRVGSIADLFAMTRPEVPLINLYVDYHDRLPAERHDYGARDRVWVTGGGGLAKDFLRTHGRGLTERQLLVGTGWCVDPTQFFPQDIPRTNDIVFIGTPFFPHDFAELMLILYNDAENRRIFLDTYDDHQREYIYDWPAALEKRGFDWNRLPPELGQFFRENYRLQMHVCDQTSGEMRVRYLSALADFDLKIYGGPIRDWILGLSVGDSRLLRRYQYRPVSDPNEVAHIYNSAKIGLNIQHDHSRGHGVSFRAFDLMACKSLLMSHSDTRVPLEELGYVEDRDYVCFESPEELRQKCRYYLKNEKRRRAITESAYEKVMARHTLPQLFGRVFGHFGFPALAHHFDRLYREMRRLSGTAATLPFNVRSLSRLPDAEAA